MDWLPHTIDSLSNMGERLGIVGLLSIGLLVAFLVLGYRFGSALITLGDRIVVAYQALTEEKKQANINTKEQNIELAGQTVQLKNINLKMDENTGVLSDLRKNTCKADTACRAHELGIDPGKFQQAMDWILELRESQRKAAADLKEADAKRAEILAGKG